MANDMRFRDRFVEFLSTPSDERDEMLSRLADDERQALMYQCYHLPVGARVDPNRLLSPPFSDREMHVLLKAATEKVTFWMVERIVEDRPPTRLTSN